MRHDGPDDVRPTGHLQIKGGPHGRVWYALWRDADGRHQKRLGRAHVRDSGRRTARGAVVWWAANGSRPDADHLTPAEADTVLRELLDTAVREPTDPAQRAPPCPRRVPDRRAAGRARRDGQRLRSAAPIGPGAAHQ